jgi:hypothetical protein
MDRGTVLYWLLVALLFGASAFFAASIVEGRASAEPGSTAAEAEAEAAP